MAATMAAVSDSDLAFQMQLNEALAASMGISTIIDRQIESGEDAGLAVQVQQLEIERLQREALDRRLAAHEVQQQTQKVAQQLHDAEVAREIDDMPEDEWEENGDLYEKPYKKEGHDNVTFRVFFKAYLVLDKGETVGVAIGGAVFDPNGNAVVELKRFIEGSMSGKNAAQYAALALTLNAARSVGARSIIAYTDSTAVYNQMTGIWKVNTNTLRNEYVKAIQQKILFQKFDINLALHGENWPADNLARQVSISWKQSTASTSKEHCFICLDDKCEEDMSTLTECGHRFCSSCIKQHIQAKLTSGVVYPVPCPQINCPKCFTEDECRCFLSGKFLELFLKRVHEAQVPEAYRLYCPYPNCSYLMDKRSVMSDKYYICCVSCKRNMCMECRVPWHYGFTCAQYKTLVPGLKDAEDAKLYKLAENQNWRQCKQCRRMIELAEGCYHMTCRCGYEFCYTCGAEWRNKMQTCSCKLWDEYRLINEPLDDELDDEEDEEEEEDDDEIMVALGRNRYYKTQLCRYFEMGYCAFGGNCKFAHGRDDLRNHPL